MLKIALALFAGFFPLAVSAQANCAPHAVIIDRLEGVFDETLQVIALTGNGMVMEVYANVETGTWTVVITAPSGPSCVVSAGQAFDLVAEAAGDPA